jgi:hypothetical protein
VLLPAGADKPIVFRQEVLNDWSDRILSGFQGYGTGRAVNRRVAADGVRDGYRYGTDKAALYR